MPLSFANSSAPAEFRSIKTNSVVGSAVFVSAAFDAFVVVVLGVRVFFDVVFMVCISLTSVVRSSSCLSIITVVVFCFVSLMWKPVLQQRNEQTPENRLAQRRSKQSGNGVDDMRGSSRQQ